MKHFITYLCRIVEFGILILLIFAYRAYQESIRLPKPEKLSEELSQAPIQTDSELEKFVFDYAKQSYLITPIAKYELWGLVVSLNNIKEFGDIYHDEASVDVRDICVVWGETAISGAYLEYSFWSEPWSCWYKPKEDAETTLFQSDELGNNHLLAANERIRNIIWELSVGDQIYISGLLVNYSPANNPSFMRKTSTIRSDQGNGACEIVFVEEVNVIEKTNAKARMNFNRLRYFLFLLVGLRVLLFFVSAYTTYPVRNLSCLPRKSGGPVE